MGNFSAELTDDNEAIRKRVVEMYDEIQDDVEDCLREAIRNGDLPRKANASELAGFFMSSQQGATLLCKVHRDVAPMRRFKRLLFSKILTKYAWGWAEDAAVSEQTDFPRESRAWGAPRCRSGHETVATPALGFFDLKEVDKRVTPPSQSSRSYNNFQGGCHDSAKRSR